MTGRAIFATAGCSCAVDGGRELVLTATGDETVVDESEVLLWTLFAMNESKTEGRESMVAVVGGGGVKSDGNAVGVGMAGNFLRCCYRRLFSRELLSKEARCGFELGWLGGGGGGGVVRSKFGAGGSHGRGIEKVSEGVVNDTTTATGRAGNGS